MKPRDAAILARLALYRNLPEAERRKILEKASPDAQSIGEALLGNAAPQEAEDMAEAIRQWAKTNRSLANQALSRK